MWEYTLGRFMEFALRVFVICPAVSPSRHHSHSPTCMDRGNIGRQPMFVDISFLANLFKRRWVWIASIGTKTNIEGGPYIIQLFGPYRP